MYENNLNNISSGWMQAEVRNNIDPQREGRIQVFIPKAMYDFDYDEEPYNEKTPDSLINKSYILNDDFKNMNLEIENSNYIWVRPMSYFEENKSNWNNKNEKHSAGSLRIPKIGSTVSVIFYDNDPQKGYYLPLSFTTDGQKISSENSLSKNLNDKEYVNVDIIRAYSNGMKIEADENNGSIRIISGNGKNYIIINDNGITLSGNININGNINCSGNYNGRGDVTSNNISLSSHVHNSKWTREAGNSFTDGPFN